MSHKSIVNMDNVIIVSKAMTDYGEILNQQCQICVDVRWWQTKGPFTLNASQRVTRHV
jgi:hypothetical protein